MRAENDLGRRVELAHAPTLVQGQGLGRTPAAAPFELCLQSELFSPQSPPPDLGPADLPTVTDLFPAGLNSNLL